MNTFKKYPFLIAEISFNFHTIAEKEDCPYFDVAKLMIKEAMKCGINAVNFHVGDSEFLHCNFEETDLNVTDKLNYDDYKQLAEFCREIGILFFITPSGFSDVDALDEFVDAYKIPASDLTNIPFIKQVSSKHKPILLSTAAATLKEIKDAINAIEDESNFKIALMHSVLSYPTELEDANLLMIKDLSEYFKEYDIGYSDYTIPGDNMFVLTTAYNYGAVILEKYFTLDKSLEGHEYSMDSEDVNVFRLNKSVLSKINGFKNKQPLICESFSRRNVRKSIFAKNDIKKGSIITESDIEFKRPALGIAPSEADNVVGKTATVDIPKGLLIDYTMLSD